MKLTYITKVAPLLLAYFFSSQSFAFDSSTTTPDLVINISGSSSQQEPLEDLIISLQICTGNITQYREINDDFRAYFCTANSNTGVASNTKILINVRSSGGSIWGVVPIARDWPVQFMNIFNSNCSDTTVYRKTASGSDMVNPAGDGIFGCEIFNPASGLVNNECPNGVAYATDGSSIAYPGGLLTHKGTGFGDTVCLPSHGGVSDVEASLFSHPSNFAFSGQTPLSDIEINALTTVSQYAVIYGVKITEHEYKWLQQIQGLVDYTAGGTTLNDDIKAASVITGTGTVPSLTKAEIAAMLTGQMSFQQLDPRIIAADINNPINNSGIYAVCRHNVGSGAQATNQEYFLQTACSQGGLPMVTNGLSDDRAQWNGNTLIVKRNTSSARVDKCLNDAVNGNISDEPGVGFNDASPVGAIGFGPINRIFDPGKDKWYFVAIDGVEPTRENARLGLYDYVYEQFFHTLSSSPNNPSHINTFLDSLAVQSGSPTTIGTVPINGTLALSANGFNWDNSLVTWRGSRGSNSCRAVRSAIDNPNISNL